MTLREVLNYLTTEGGITVALNLLLGIGESFLADWWPAFQKFEPRVKRVIIIMASFVIPLGATFLKWAIDGALPSEEMWWAAILAGGMAFLASQAKHIPKLGG